MLNCMGGKKKKTGSIITSGRPAKSVNHNLEIEDVDDSKSFNYLSGGYDSIKTHSRSYMDRGKG